MSQDPADTPQEPVHMAKDGYTAPPPGTYPPGSYPPPNPQAAVPPGTYPQGSFPPGAYPQGPVSPGMYPPGQSMYGPIPGYRQPSPPRSGVNVPVWWLVAVPVLLVVVIVIAAGAVIYMNRPDSDSDALPLTTTTTAVLPTGTMIMQLPNPVQKKPAMVSCAYRATPGPQQIPAQLPKTADIRANTGGRVPYQMNTGLGVIGLSLDTAASPCTVNSFISLAAQHYYDATKCHRMTTSLGLKVLQCGDPTGTGMGGPGYEFENEYPTDVFASPEKAATEQVLYPRGTLAMANAGPDPLTGAGTNGSQFFLVYGDSTLPPTYTVFGTVDQAGLAVLDRVAAAGMVAGGEDGEPKLTVEIGSIAAK